MKNEANRVKQAMCSSAILALVALVLPAVAGCKTCEGGACAITASETGKTLSESGSAVVSTQTLKTMLAAGTNLVLLDARSGKFDDGRRIPGALSVNAQSSDKEVSAAVKSRDTLIVTYCSNLKCPASSALAKHLRELGYKNVLEYSEGIAGWTEAGLRTEQIEK